MIRQRLLALGAFTVAIFALWASVARADDAPVPCNTFTVCTHDRVPPPQQPDWVPPGHRT